MKQYGLGLFEIWGLCVDRKLLIRSAFIVETRPGAPVTLMQFLSGGLYKIICLVGCLAGHCFAARRSSALILDSRYHSVGSSPRALIGLSAAMKHTPKSIGKVQK